MCKKRCFQLEVGGKRFVSVHARERVQLSGDRVQDFVFLPPDTCPLLCQSFIFRRKDDHQENGRPESDKFFPRQPAQDIQRADR